MHMVIDAIRVFFPGVALTLLSMWGALMWFTSDLGTNRRLWVKLARGCILFALGRPESAKADDPLVGAWLMLDETVGPSKER